MKKVKHTAPTTITNLLKEAIEKPGMLLEAYRAFHSFSIMNQMLAYYQCRSGGYNVGPIATFKQWKEKGRTVKKGEKAMVLCMPCVFNKKDKAGNKTEETGMYFMYVKRWFTVEQTEGEDVKAVDLPNWEIESALENLKIEMVAYDMAEGNVQGYALDNTIAINPLAQLPNKTMFHELAHIVLGHQSGEDKTTQAIREVEAEATAMCLLDINEMEGANYCRGYIQLWLGRSKENIISEGSARRILNAVNAIMDAGKPQKKKAA